VYIREAHPTDGWALPKKQCFVIPDPKTIEERRKVAREFRGQVKVTIPILVDTLDDHVEKAYAGWPDRIYVIDAEGRSPSRRGRGRAVSGPGVEAAPSVCRML